MELPSQREFVLRVRGRSVRYHRLLLVLTVLIGAVMIRLGSGENGIRLFVFLHRHFFDDFQMELVLPLLSILSLYFLLLLLMFPFLLLRCPDCRRRYLWTPRIMAGGECPVCGKRLFHAETLHEITLLRPDFSLFQGTFYYIIALMLPALFTVYYLSHDIPLAFYLQVFWLLSGTIFLCYPLYIRIFERITARKQKHACPVCSEELSDFILKMSGNCHNCGSRIDHGFPPEEPEEAPELPTLREVEESAIRNRKRDNLLFLLLLLWCNLCLWGPFPCLPLFPIGVLPLVLLGYAIFYFIHRPPRSMRVFRRCPYCKTWIGGNHCFQYALCFRRCPKCFRRLVKK